MSYSEQRESVSASAPTFVGPYKLGKTLGQGVFAKVRLGEDDLGRRFAVKEFDKKAHRSEAHLKQVERELNALRILDHPNICQFSEVLETQTKVFLVMEYVSGGELYEYIHKTGKLPELDAARLFYQICSAVAHCHNNNIAHRDLKPENILLTEPDPVLAAKFKPKDGLEGRQAKIVDLGLANFTGRDKYGEPMTKELKDAMFKTQCGSPHYAAPEVLLARDYKGRPVDIWSLGIILYAMLCARLPFHAATIPQLINKIVEGKYQIPDHVSSTAKNLIHNMLKIRPEERLDINKVMEHEWIKSHGPHFILPSNKEKGVTPASSTQLTDDGKGVKDKSKREARCATCHKLLNMRVGKEGYVFLSSTGVGGDADKKEGGDSEKAIPGISEADLCHCQAKEKASDKKADAEYDPAQLEEQFFRAAETGDVHRLHAILKIASGNPDLLKLDATATAKKWTALHYAAMMGHIQIVEALLTSMQKVDIDAVAEDGRTPLMLAAERGKLEVVRLFIECGADIHHTNKKGKTAIYMARERQFYDIASLLTEYSSEKRKRNENQDLKSQFRDHLYKCAEDGDEEKLKVLLKQHFVLNTDGATGAMAEPKSPHPETAPAAEGDDGKDGKGGLMNLGVTSMDNFTCLHHAARKGHVGVVNTLLTYVQGARKMLNIDAKTRSGWTPLMLAADRGRTAVVKLLLELGANPALTTNDDKTAEDLAKEQGHTECAKLLEKTKLIFLD